MPMGHDTSRAHPLGRSPRSCWGTERRGIALAPIANEPQSSFVGVGGFVRPQDNPGPVTAPLSPLQRRDGVLNASAGRYSHQSALEPQASYPLGFVNPQNPRPMTAARQHIAGSHSHQLSNEPQSPYNTFGGPYSHQSSNEPQSSYPLGSVNPQNQRPMPTARLSPPQRHAGVQNTFGGPHSQRTGRAKKRKALVIGTNYSRHAKPQFRLRHCVEDAERMADFLCDKLGFKLDDIRLMTDKTPWDLPTKDNILGAMEALVDGAQPGDSFFFIVLSGHGVQIKDTNGDEVDGLDECICAIDYRGDDPRPTCRTTGLIVDDTMHDILVKPLPRGCRLTAMFDVSYVNNIMQYEYTDDYDLNGKVKPIIHPDKLWLLSQKESRADVVSLGASKDNQRALETHLGGALRRAFIECVRAYGDTLTYRGLLQSIRGYMINQGFKQRPQDTNILFIT
ncbi:caspase domain-containing protein [Russula vinacea]|nr:caspase domain-containing protein [Russula vinacea]